MHHSTVTIYHNVNTDDEGRMTGYSGYRTGDAVTPVFTYAVSVNETNVAEKAFAMFNSYPDEMHTSMDNLPMVKRYRANKLRSLSVGDLVQVGLFVYSCERSGFQFRGLNHHTVFLNVQPNPFDNFTD